jgi:hypothetical protein
MSEQPSEHDGSKDSMREKFDKWYASPRGEAQFDLGMHYIGWAYVCYAEGYKQAAIDMGKDNG